MKNRAVLPILIILILSLLLCGCDSMDTEAAAQIQPLCEEFIDAVLAVDPDAAYAVLTPGTDRSSFDAAWPVLRRSLQDVESYTLEFRNYHYNNTNGQKSWKTGFLMETNAGNFAVEGTIAEGYEGLYSINIVPGTGGNPIHSGSFSRMSGATPFQWLMLAVSAALLVFVIIVLIDCIRLKPKYMALWIILILGGALIFSITHIVSGGGSINLNIGIYILQYSSFILYENGDSIFRLVLPVGAVVYLCLRRRLNNREQASGEAVPAGDDGMISE